MADQEQDLGVVVDSVMKILTQCAAAVKVSNSTLGVWYTNNKTLNVAWQPTEAVIAVVSAEAGIFCH